MNFASCWVLTPRRWEDLGTSILPSDGPRSFVLPRHKAHPSTFHSFHRALISWPYDSSDLCSVSDSAAWLEYGEFRGRQRQTSHWNVPRGCTANITETSSWSNGDPRLQTWCTCLSSRREILSALLLRLLNTLRIHETFQRQFQISRRITYPKSPHKN